MSYPGERSFADVLQDIIGNVQAMIRSEIRLAKAEVREESGKAAKAGMLLAIGAVLGVYAVGFVLLATLKVLEATMTGWLASLIVAGLAGLISFGVISVGRGRMKRVHGTPEKTVQSIKENMQWVKEQTR